MSVVLSQETETIPGLPLEGEMPLPSGGDKTVIVNSLRPSFYPQSVGYVPSAQICSGLLTGCAQMK